MSTKVNILGSKLTTRYSQKNICFQIFFTFTLIQLMYLFNCNNEHNSFLKTFLKRLLFFICRLWKLIQCRPSILCLNQIHLKKTFLLISIANWLWYVSKIFLAATHLPCSLMWVCPWCNGTWYEVWILRPRFNSQQVPNTLGKLTNC